MALEINDSFGIPADVEARLRAQAETAVAVMIDEAALLVKFTEEAKAKRLAGLKEKADAADIAAALAENTPDAHGFPRKYFWVTVHEGQDAGALSYATPSLNGYTWQIQRGVKAIVHSVALNVLDEAIEDKPVRFEGGLITRPVPMFPYTIHGEATEAEYLAFTAKMRTQGGRAVV